VTRLPVSFLASGLGFLSRWKESIHGAQSNSDYIVQGSRVSPGFVHHVDALRYPDTETGQRPTLLSAVPRTRDLRTAQDMIQRRLLLP
jgi:hypothetical protein